MQNMNVGSHCLQIAWYEVKYGILQRVTLNVELQNLLNRIYQMQTLRRIGHQMQTVTVPWSGRSLVYLPPAALASSGSTNEIITIQIEAKINAVFQFGKTNTMITIDSTLVRLPFYHQPDLMQQLSMIIWLCRDQLDQANFPECQYLHPAMVGTSTGKFSVKRNIILHFFPQLWKLTDYFEQPWKLGPGKVKEDSLSGNVPSNF